jgi:hypothetical protein
VAPVRYSISILRYSRVDVEQRHILLSSPDIIGVPSLLYLCHLSICQDGALVSLRDLVQ